MKSSFRLGVLLVGLVAINVYVFFFNRKTAPREVLNLQSTAKTMETTRRDPRAVAPSMARNVAVSRPRILTWFGGWNGCVVAPSKASIDVASVISLA